MPQPMSSGEAILLGVIQGLTEFLPISSTAHLLVARKLMGHENPNDAFTTVIQLGTLIAVLIYFAKDIARLTLAVLRDFAAFKIGSSPESKLAWLIVLGTVPVVLVGLKFKTLIKQSFYDIPTMGAVAILFALLMLASEVWTVIRKVDLGKVDLDERQITTREALWVGCWQCLALMPGASRSGTTITAGLFTPSEVKVPAGTKVKLVVDNQDATAEEFESKDLKREKVIPPRSKGTFVIGPLKPGRYKFVGEFHEKTAQGVVIAE